MQQKAQGRRVDVDARLVSLIDELEAEGVDSTLATSVLMVYAIHEILDSLEEHLGRDFRERVVENAILRARRRLLRGRHLRLVE